MGITITATTIVNGLNVIQLDPDVQGIVAGNPKLPLFNSLPVVCNGFAGMDI
jgi:hypothetical protein